MQEVLDAMHKNRVGWQEHDDYKLEESQRPGIYFGNRIPELPALTTCGGMIERFCSFKMLGVWHQDNLKWNTHIEKIAKKACEMFSCLSECRRNNLSTEVGVIWYQTKIRSLWEYRAPIWGGIPQYLVDELESIQTRSLWILGLPKDSLPSLLERSHVISLCHYLLTIHTAWKIKGIIPIASCILIDINNLSYLERRLWYCNHGSYSNHGFYVYFKKALIIHKNKTQEIHVYYCPYMW